MGEKFLNLSGLSFYDQKVKSWSQEKIKDAINKLSAVAKSGSYHDLTDKTHDLKVNKVTLENSSIQFSYRSDDFNRVEEANCYPVYYNDGTVSCQLVSGYYYNVTFGGTSYENLLAETVHFTDPVSSTAYVGLGNRSLFTNSILMEISDEEKLIPFYLVTLDKADPNSSNELGRVWLFTKEKGTYTFTVQCTGEKKYEAKPLVSVGMYAYGATTMEEFMEIMSGETLPPLPTFDPNETYTFTFGDHTYNLSPKFVNGADFDAEGQTMTYFGCEDLIIAAISTLGDSAPDIPFEQHEEGDFAALFLTIPDGSGQAIFATATSLPLETNPDYGACGPYTFEFIEPGTYVDMNILQMQIPDLDPFTQTFYADMSSSGPVITPVLTEQEVTLETLDIDRELSAVAYEENVLGEHLYGSDFEYINNRSHALSCFVNDKYFNSTGFVWKTSNAFYYGNAFLVDDFSDVDDLDNNFSDEEKQYIKECPFFIKLEQVSDYSSSNRLYNATFYTKYQGSYKIRNSSNEDCFEFVSRYPIVKYDRRYDDNSGHMAYSVVPEKVLENTNFVVDWYKCLSDNLRLVKGQKLSVLLGKTTYEVEVKEDESTGFVYAGNPEFLPAMYYIPNLDYSKKDEDVPFIICTINHENSSSSDNYYNLRSTTRVFFNRDVISEVIPFNVSYETVSVTEPFKTEAIESSLPSLDWNVDELSSKSHILNRTHFDSRKGHACLPQLAYFSKSLYDSTQGGYYITWPEFEPFYDCSISLTVKYDNSTVIEKNYEVTFDPEVSSYSQTLIHKNDDLFVVLSGDEQGDNKLHSIIILVDYSLFTEEMIQDLESVTLDVEVTTKSESVLIQGIGYAARPSSGTYSYSIGTCYYGRYQKARRYNSLTHQQEDFYVTNYNMNEWYVRSLPYVRDGIYTVVFNGKKYKFNLETTSQSSTYYAMLGSRNYARCGLYNSYNSPYMWDNSNTKYDELKFGITLRYKVCPDNTIKFISGTVSADSDEMSDSFSYPNFTGLDIYYGELKELDSKYIPKAKEITDGSDGFTTGEQVYDYVESLTITDSFINGLFETTPNP